MTDVTITPITAPSVVVQPGQGVVIAPAAASPAVIISQQGPPGAEGGGGGGGGVTDGDKGDIVVSGSGATWTIDPTILSAQGRALIDDTDAAAQRATLGLGTAATQPTSAFQAALGFTPENAASKGVAGGYAGLDGTGKVPSSQLPSFVDDVLEFANLAALPGTGSAGVIYVTLDTNRTYRWSGATYIEISASPGSTDAVAEGSVNLYFTAARVLGVVLSGLSTATNAAVTAADTILSGIGKLQAQFTAHFGAGGSAHAAATTGADGFMSAADKTKLNGVATGATANATDAQLRDRSTHTGTQLAATISDFGEAVDDEVAGLLVAGANITLTYNDGANTLTIAAAGGGGGGGTPADIQAFSASGTWTKPAGAKMSRIVCIGGGGGGGSGRKGASLTFRSGGGGGAGGGWSERVIDATLLGATETVTIGAGGAGGAAVTAASTNGNVGTAGGATTFGSWVQAGGGGVAAAAAAAALGAAAGGAGSVTGGAGGGTATSNNPAVPAPLGIAPGGGAAGGSIRTTDATSAAQAGGSNGSGAIGTGGAAASPGAAGQAMNIGDTAGGTGGGGGLSNGPGTTISNGGAGGFPGGGGGGGSAVIDATANSGAGGAGAGGYCIVFTTF